MIRRTSRVQIVCAYLFFYLCCPQIALSSWDQQAEITNGAASDQFGASVAIQGDRVIVGALQGNGNAADSGAAYIFQRSGTMWSQTAKLVASDGNQFANFGYSVSIDGDRALVGAKDSSRSGRNFAGSAYVYDQTNGVWTQSTRLIASDAATADSFGASVSILGNRAVVGATNDDYSSVSDAGSAYVFDRSPGGIWTQSTKLAPTDPQSSANFGYSTSLAADRVVIGTPYFSGVRSRSGAAYIFDNQSGAWSQTAKLVAPDAENDAFFGYSIATSGNRILVGAPAATSLGMQRAGAAYVFEFQNGNWIETARLIDPAPFPDDNFGISVSLDGNRAVVGGSGVNFTRGAAFVFDLISGSWTNIAKLQAVDATLNDAFGETVGLAGDTAVVGARLADPVSGADAGAAYIYTIPEPSTSDLVFLGVASVIGLCKLDALTPLWTIRLRLKVRPVRAGGVKPVRRD
jgi:hypothetical protein